MRSGAKPRSSIAASAARCNSCQRNRATSLACAAICPRFGVSTPPSQELSEVQDILEGRMLAAQQELSDEMRRLLEQSRRRREPDAMVGGIPVDSEYIIFVIDTSGSMFHYAWPAVVEKMTQVLDTYPRVKGLQIMNDMGQYMYSQYAGKWIPDTPGRRKAVIARLRSWSVLELEPGGGHHPSHPHLLPTRDHRISIYVFGDEFTGPSIDEVVREVDRLNTRAATASAGYGSMRSAFLPCFSVAGAGEAHRGPLLHPDADPLPPQ